MTSRPRADDFFAVAVFDALREKRAEFGELRQHFDFVEEALRRFHGKEAADAVGDFFEAIDFEREFHASDAAESVYEQREFRAFGLFEEQSRADAVWFAFWVAGDALGDFGDFEDGIDFRADALEFAFFFELSDKLTQIAIRHSLLQRALLPR